MVMSLKSILNNINNFNIPFFSSLQLYVDIGTSVTRIAIKEKGIVLKEPSYLTINTRNKDYLFYGSEAKEIVGKTPEYLKIVKPIINGIISDFDAEVALIKYFIEKSVIHYLHNNHIFKPTLKVLASCPLVATEIELKAVQEVFLKAGCASVDLIEKPLATASGCGLHILSHKPNLIVDLGGGLVEISIVSGGGIVSSRSLKIAGESMDKIIANYIHLKHGIILGESTTEKLKITTLNFGGAEEIALIRGKSLETGLPKSLKIKTSEIKESLLTTFSQIIEAIKELIEAAPPEVVDEIYNNGILLTGGLSQINGIDKYFSEELKIACITNHHYGDTTINGLIHLGKNKSIIQRLNR